MGKQKAIINMQTYGIHSHWDAKSKELPKIKEFTTTIPAEIDIEFGFIINIKNARGAKINYCIAHPQVHDKQGHPCDPFVGEVHVTNNNWLFYLGDTLWEPLADKCGPWRMTIALNKTIIADKTFVVFTQKAPSEEADFWKRCGY